MPLIRTVLPARLMHLAGLAVTTVIALPLLTTDASAQLVSCESIQKDWLAMPLSAGHEDRVRIYDQAFNDSDCDGMVVEGFGKEIIDARLDVIAPFQDLEGYTGNLETLKQDLADLQEFGSHWRISYLLGEILRKQQQTLPAFRAYQEALGLVDATELTPAEPAHAMIARLRDRLDELAVVVAQISEEPGDIKIPVTRSGQSISQYSFSTRGYKRKKTLVPIQFVYDQDVMTKAGRTSFEDVQEALEKQGSPDIQVVGHTDPVGSDAYNMQLSMKRAEAVRSALLAAGYSGSIEVLGMGESQPFQFDNPSLYTEDVRNQAHRRVEFVQK